MEQTEKTKKFISYVDRLIDRGEVKNYAAIIQELDWDKTMFSSVINGRKNVPNDIYKKFTEVYQIENTEDKEQHNTISTLLNHQDRLISVIERLTNSIAPQKDQSKLIADCLNHIAKDAVVAACMFKH